MRLKKEEGKSKETIHLGWLEVLWPPNNKMVVSGLIFHDSLKIARLPSWDQWGRSSSLWKYVPTVAHDITYTRNHRNSRCKIFFIHMLIPWQLAIFRSDQQHPQKAQPPDLQGGPDVLPHSYRKNTAGPQAPLHILTPVKYYRVSLSILKFK